jgi:hypothetical protein
MSTANCRLLAPCSPSLLRFLRSQINSSGIALTTSQCFQRSNQDHTLNFTNSKRSFATDSTHQSEVRIATRYDNGVCGVRAGDAGSKAQLSTNSPSISQLNALSNTLSGGKRPSCSSLQPFKQAAALSRTFSTNSPRQEWTAWWKYWTSGAAARGRQLPPLASFLDASTPRHRILKAANEPRLRCTEFDENGNVTLVNGEFKKSELIAKV